MSQVMVNLVALFLTRLHVSIYTYYYRIQCTEKKPHVWTYWIRQRSHLVALVSARVPAKNGAVFRHLNGREPNLKMYSHSKSRAHAHEIVGKVPGNQRKTCAHKDPVPSLVPENKVGSSTARGRCRILNFKCVLSLDSNPGTKCEHCLRTCSL